ncbi:MAG: MIP/aquaporin family protein [Fimbriimonadaceae bacterium]
MLRRCGAEFVGTFVIAFAPISVSAGGKLAGGDGTLLTAALVSGLAVLAMIFAFGPVSAAHFNPAVTLGFASTRRFAWRHVPAYWASQFAGAICAALLALLLFGHPSGAHIPADTTAVTRNLGIEAVTGCLLMLVISAVATDRRVSDAIPGLAIGFTVVIGVLVGGPITGGSMNPARSLGPALVTGGAALANYWIYAVGPCLGAVIGARTFEALRLEPLHAKGAPHELAP